MDLNKLRKWVHIVLLGDHDGLEWQLSGFFSFFLSVTFCSFVVTSRIKDHGGRNKERGCTYCDPPLFSSFNHLKFNDENTPVSVQTRPVSPGWEEKRTKQAALHTCGFQSSYSTCNFFLKLISEACPASEDNQRVVARCIPRMSLTDRRLSTCCQLVLTHYCVLKCHQTGLTARPRRLAALPRPRFNLFTYRSDVWNVNREAYRWAINSAGHGADCRSVCLRPCARSYTVFDCSFFRVTAPFVQMQPELLKSLPRVKLFRKLRFTGFSVCNI